MVILTLCTYNMDTGLAPARTPVDGCMITSGDT